MLPITAVRIVISVFVALIALAAVIGWVWTGEHQPPAGAFASRIVLSITAAAGAGALLAVWRHQVR